MMECKSGGGAVVVRTVTVVFRDGGAVRVHHGELLQPNETAHECTIGEAVEARHLIIGRPVTETEMRR